MLSMRILAQSGIKRLGRTGGRRPACPRHVNSSLFLPLLFCETRAASNDWQTAPKRPVLNGAEPANTAAAGPIDQCFLVQFSGSVTPLTRLLPCCGYEEACDVTVAPTLPDGRRARQQSIVRRGHMSGYRFGKHPPKHDYRTLRFKDYLSRELAAPPPEMNVLARVF